MQYDILSLVIKVVLWHSLILTQIRLVLDWHSLILTQIRHLLVLDWHSLILTKIRHVLVLDWHSLILTQIRLVRDWHSFQWFEHSLAWFITEVLRTHECLMDCMCTWVELNVQGLFFCESLRPYVRWRVWKTCHIYLITVTPWFRG